MPTNALLTYSVDMSDHCSAFLEARRVLCRPSAGTRTGPGIQRLDIWPSQPALVKVSWSLFIWVVVGLSFEIAGMLQWLWDFVDWKGRSSRDSSESREDNGMQDDLHGKQ